MSFSPSHWILMALLILVPAAGHGQPGASNTSKQHLSRNIEQQEKQLIFSGGTAPVQVSLDGWQVSGTPVGRLLSLTRPTPRGTEMKLFDPSGLHVGGALVPPGFVAVATNRNIIVFPEALHMPVRAHDLRFLSLLGEPIKAINDPNLSVVRWEPLPEGEFITVNIDTATGGARAVVYGADGRILWNVVSSTAGYPDVSMSPDGMRLMVLNRNPSEGTALLDILAPGNRLLKRHALPNVVKVETSPDSKHIGAVGQQLATVIDASTGETVWRRDENIDFVLPGGVRFIADTLQIMGAKRDQQRGTAMIQSFRLGLSDGSMERTDIEETPLDRVPSLIDMDSAPDGTTKFIFHDRIRSIGPPGKKRP